MNGSQGKSVRVGPCRAVDRGGRAYVSHFRFSIERAKRGEAEGSASGVGIS